MTLRIKPVKLNQSIYIRIPNDIADLIGIDSDSEITLNLEQQQERFLLIYSMARPQVSKTYTGVHESLDHDDAEQLAPLPASQHSSEVQKVR